VDGGFHGRLVVLVRYYGAGNAQIKGRGSLAAAPPGSKRQAKKPSPGTLSLSTEAVDKSVDGEAREGAFTQSDCIIVTLIKI